MMMMIIIVHDSTLAPCASCAAAAAAAAAAVAMPLPRRQRPRHFILQCGGVMKQQITLKCMEDQFHRIVAPHSMDIVQLRAAVQADLSPATQKLLSAAASMQSNALPRFSHPPPPKHLAKAAVDRVKVGTCCSVISSELLLLLLQQRCFL